MTRTKGLTSSKRFSSGTVKLTSVAGYAKDSFCDDQSSHLRPSAATSIDLHAYR